MMRLKVLTMQKQKVELNREDLFKVKSQSTEWSEQKSELISALRRMARASNGLVCILVQGGARCLKWDGGLIATR